MISWAIASAGLPFTPEEIRIAKSSASEKSLRSHLARFSAGVMPHLHAVPPCPAIYERPTRTPLQAISSIPSISSVVNWTGLAFILLEAAAWRTREGKSPAVTP